MQELPLVSGGVKNKTKTQKLPMRIMTGSNGCERSESDTLENHCQSEQKDR